MVQIPKSRCQQGAVFSENKSINHKKLPFPHVFVMLLLLSPGSANGKKITWGSIIFCRRDGRARSGKQKPEFGGVGEVGGEVIE